MKVETTPGGNCVAAQTEARQQGPQKTVSAAGDSSEVVQHNEAKAPVDTSAREASHAAKAQTNSTSHSPVSSSATPGS